MSRREQHPTAPRPHPGAPGRGCRQPPSASSPDRKKDHALDFTASTVGQRAPRLIRSPTSFSPGALVRYGLTAW